MKYPTSTLPGMVFGKLTILREAAPRNKKRWVVTQCACGKISERGLQQVIGKTRSCKNCMHLVHGHAPSSGNHSPTYRNWAGIVQRCSNPNNISYSSYGGRGVTVCDRWKSFDNFLADMGERPKGLEIDRIDNDKGYSPDNCRWVTPAQNARNKRSNVWVEFMGDTLCLTDACKKFNVQLPTVCHAVKKEGVTHQQVIYRLHRKRVGI